MGLKSGSRDAGLDETETDEAGQKREPESVGDESRKSEQPAAAPATTRPEQAEDEPHEQLRAQEQAQGHEQQESEQARRHSQPHDRSEADRTQRPTIDSLPYKLRREKVNEGREQVPYFLREEVIEAEDGLQAALEELLGEKVYKSDYREAAMVVAQRNPELVADVLREWGYDLNTS